MVTACVHCNVRKGNRTPKEANMPLRNQPRRPYSSLYFEVAKYLKGGSHREWQKYVIGSDQLRELSLRT
jgi:hypothetical protein